MSSLLAHINYAKAYRANRLAGAHWVMKHPETLPELIDYVFLKTQEEITHKAAWVLEFVALEDLSLLYPHLDLFFEGITFPKKDQTVRPLANISEKLCLAYYKNSKKYVKPPLTVAHKEIIVEASFDWIIADKKVACTARAMTCLYLIGNEIKWIHPELKIILEQKLPTGSAGYNPRAQTIISLIANRTC
jgi:hypothetical protein